jgi:hypothetical protein
MNDYAAVWSRGERPTEPFVVGRVAIQPGLLVLEGQTSEGMRCSREIHADEIRTIERMRRSVERGRRTGLRLELMSGEPLVFTEVLGVGASIDLLDAVQALIVQAHGARRAAAARREEAAALRSQARLQMSRAEKAARRSRELLRDDAATGPTDPPAGPV